MHRSLVISREMRIRDEMKKMVSMIGPFLFFMIVNAAVSSCLEAFWFYILKDRALTADGPAYARTVLHFWNLFSMAVPPGIGCLAVRRDLLRELFRFRADYEKREAEREKSLEKGRLSEKTLAGRYSVLLCSAAALSLGLNLFLSMYPGRPVSANYYRDMSGPVMFVSSSLFFGLMIPLIEEAVFRGILFSSLEREYGFRPAAVFSALLFGLYHASWLQGLYAFVMGIVFACAYESTGRFSVPWTMHGLCNLTVLLLGWAGVYEKICTPGWTAAFLAVAAGGFWTAHRITTGRL